MLLNSAALAGCCRTQRLAGLLLNSCVRLMTPAFAYAHTHPLTNSARCFAAQDALIAALRADVARLKARWEEEGHVPPKAVAASKLYRDTLARADASAREALSASALRMELAEVHAEGAAVLRLLAGLEVVRRKGTGRPEGSQWMAVGTYDCRAALDGDAGDRGAWPLWRGPRECLISFAPEKTFPPRRRHKLPSALPQTPLTPHMGASPASAAVALPTHTCRALLYARCNA